MRRVEAQTWDIPSSITSGRSQATVHLYYGLRRRAFYEKAQCWLEFSPFSTLHFRSLACGGPKDSSVASIATPFLNRNAR